jgi:uncharacterized OB-fold protein
VTISDAEVLARYPGERVDQDNVDYYRGLLGGELRAMRCRDCGRWSLPHRAYCPECWSSEVRAERVSGRGTVHLLVFLHQGAPVPDIDYQAGYPLATVELVEQTGLRVSAGLVNCARAEMRIGLPVELCFVEREGAPLPAFRPLRAHT